MCGEATCHNKSQSACNFFSFISLVPKPQAESASGSVKQPSLSPPPCPLTIGPVGSQYPPNLTNFGSSSCSMKQRRCRWIYWLCCAVFFLPLTLPQLPPEPLTRSPQCTVLRWGLCDVSSPNQCRTQAVPCTHWTMDVDSMSGGAELDVSSHRLTAAWGWLVV